MRVPSSPNTKARAAFDRYKESLANIPSSGGGGCHPALLSIANRGRIAGVSSDQVAEDLEAHVHGTRKIPRSEIGAAVNKAFAAFPDIPFRNTTPRPLVDGAKLIKAIVERGAGFKKADLRIASPIRVGPEPVADAIELLRRLYRPEERLFIGTKFDSGAEHVLQVSEWIKRIESGIAIPEHIIPNPLTGVQNQAKDGKPSYRADACVARFRFAVVEFDAMPREQQIQFWAGVKLPIVALLDSGGKSVHGWIRIDANNAHEWEQRVEVKLFSLLTPVGADGACKNEARLSRMPGHFRAEKNKWQRLLFLNPAGGPIIR